MFVGGALVTDGPVPKEASGTGTVGRFKTEVCGTCVVVCAV